MMAKINFAARHGNQVEKLDIIADEVCKYYDVEIEDLRDVSRDPRFIWPRLVVMAIAANFKINSKAIAKCVNRSRTMPSHAKKQVKNFCDVNAEARSEVQHLLETIKQEWIKIRLA
jgi:chromosomal replication initiation ATPase DnaA